MSPDVPAATGRRLLCKSHPSFDTPLLEHGHVHSFQLFTCRPRSDSANFVDQRNGDILMRNVSRHVFQLTNETRPDHEPYLPWAWPVCVIKTREFPYKTRIHHRQYFKLRCQLWFEWWSCSRRRDKVPIIMRSRFSTACANPSCPQVSHTFWNVYENWRKYHFREILVLLNTVTKL